MPTYVKLWAAMCYLRQQGTRCVRICVRQHPILRPDALIETSPDTNPCFPALIETS